MEQLGERYVVTLDPWSVDDMGCRVEPSRPTNQPRPSTNKTINLPGMNELFSDLNNTPNFSFNLRTDRKANVEKGKEKSFDMHMIVVDRIPQEWIEQEVYQDKLGNYYLAQKHPLDDLPEKNVLFGETWAGTGTQ